MKATSPPGGSGCSAGAELHRDQQNKCQHKAERPAWKMRVFAGMGKSLHMQYLHSSYTSFVPLCSVELNLQKKKLLVLEKTAGF